MRFDTPVFFESVVQGEYNPLTGDYGVDRVTETKRYASVTDAGAETLNLIYGELRQGSKVVRLQTQYSQPFDRVRIGEKNYRVDFSRTLPAKSVFVVSEVG